MLKWRTWQTWRTQTTFFDLLDFWLKSFSSNKVWPCGLGRACASKVYEMRISQFFRVQILYLVYGSIDNSCKLFKNLKWTKIVASTHLTKNLSITKVSCTDCIHGKFLNIFFSNFSFSIVVSTKMVSIRPVKTPKLCMLIETETQLEFLRGIRESAVNSLH